MPYGKPHPPEVKEAALDLIAKDKAANGGRVPWGAFQRAADKLGLPQCVVWTWWDDQDEEDESKRVAEFTQARERWRKAAVSAGERLLESLMAKVDDEAFPLDERTATNLLSVVQRISDNEKDAADMLQTINLRVNGDDRKVPDETPPIPDLPDLEN